jgi:hypothetical protein
VEQLSERPTRAELRRAREAGSMAEPATAAPTAVPGRAALRALHEERTRRPNPVRVLLTAWWFYPLLLVLVVALVLGWKSAAAPRPSDRPVVVETVPPPSP